MLSSVRAKGAFFLQKVALMQTRHDNTMQSSFFWFDRVQPASAPKLFGTAKQSFDLKLHPCAVSPKPSARWTCAVHPSVPS